MTTLIGQEKIWNECINQFDNQSHIFITGAPGCGKTTLMRELLKKYATLKNRPYSDKWGEESTDECLLLGPDNDRGIQTIRGHVSLFIRQRSIGEQIFRWVVIDDVDTFPQISQQALRRPMESYSHITRFLFIGTSEEDLIPALRSRCIHIAMNNINPIFYKSEFLNYVHFHNTTVFTEEMWSWIISIANNNISDIIRLLKLISDTHNILHMDITLKNIQILCSTPFYTDFFPLLASLSMKDTVQSIHYLLSIWKKGYAYEDILESFQIINTLFGTSNFSDNILVHKFLINAWVSYCKGNTSLLALQNTLYKTLTCDDTTSFSTDTLQQYLKT